MVDIKYSQNFYTNSNHLKQMIRQAGFKVNDTVIDIGAGDGMIAKELSSYTNNVIAFELDNNYFQLLRKKLQEYSQIELINENFLKTELPKKEFSVFSNIPFSQTTDIITKITDSSSNLSQAFLFVQREAAERFSGDPINTQIATILNAKYSIYILDELDSRDFRPTPRVDIVLLKIQSKRNDFKEFELYRDFVTYVFNQTSRSVLDTFDKLFTSNQIKRIMSFLKRNQYYIPSDIPSQYYIEIFNIFLTNGESYRKKVIGFYEKYVQSHINREKINRTRSLY